MEGHAAMDMSVTGQRHVLASADVGGRVHAVSHIFVMEWAAVLRDIVIGLLIAGAIGRGCPRILAALLPRRPSAAVEDLGTALGPLVAVVSFVCSIGNVPLAAVLWNGGISFGGVVASSSPT